MHRAINENMEVYMWLYIAVGFFAGTFFASIMMMLIIRSIKTKEPSHNEKFLAVWKENAELNRERNEHLKHIEMSIRKS